MASPAEKIDFNTESGLGVLHMIFARENDIKNKKALYCFRGQSCIFYVLGDTGRSEKMFLLSSKNHRTEVVSINIRR